MAIRTQLTEEIAERTTPRLAWTFVDENSDTVTSLTTATVTLYDKASGSIINSREDVSLLSDGLNVVSAGVATWVLSVADCAVVNPNKPEEVHVALIEWTWSSGTKAGKHEIEHTVRNFAKVP